MTTSAITGLQGEGKTHFALDHFILPNLGKRPIFTNIDGLKIDGVEDIPLNEFGHADWQLCPKADAAKGLLGSLVIYDEAQKLTDKNGTKYFAAKTREPVSPLTVIAELDEHRHDGYDIVFITQEITLLHSHLIKLIKEHYHCIRPFNKKETHVHLWRSVQRNPNGQAAIDRAEDVFKVPLKEKNFKLYKSTEAVTDSKVRIPGYMWRIAIIGIVCAAIGIAIMGNGINHFKDGGIVRSSVTNIDTTKQAAQGLSSTGDIAQSNLSDLCRKGENVSKPECVKWFDDLSKSGSSVDFKSSSEYDPAKPYDVKYTPEFSPNDFPRFKNALVHNGKCYAYSQQGTLMHNVSSADCFRLANGDRPFDYYYERPQQVSNNESVPQVDLIPSVSDPKVKTEPLQNVKEVMTTTDPKEII